MVIGGDSERERKVDPKMIKITTKGRGTKGGPEPTPEDEFQKNYMGGLGTGGYAALSVSAAWRE